MTALHPEKQDDSHVTVPLLTDGDSFGDFLELLHDSINLRRSDSHAPGIQHGIRAPVDDDPVVFGELGVVAVTPDIREALEIGLPVFRIAGVVPERDRHRGERGRANELAFLFANGLTPIVEYFHFHSQAAALELAAIHGKGRIADGETRDQIGAPGDGGKLQVLFDVFVHEVVARRSQRRTRG